MVVKMNVERKEHGNYSLLRLISVGNKNTLTGGVTAMRKKNDNRQVEKRQRITDATLVIGMDIGCEFNAMCLMNKEGTVLGRYPKIYNSRKGFDYFHGVIEVNEEEVWIHRCPDRHGAHRPLLEEDRLLCHG